MRPSNMFSLFTEIYCSRDEVILEQFWRLLYSGFKVVFNNYLLLLQYVFILTAGKMATALAHQRNILEIQKSVEVLS